jgi:hypothetical protein
MRKFLFGAAVLGGALGLAAPALADGSSAREVQSAVDAYLASANGDATLVGGAGSAGYDGGFWIRGGSFLLKINVTLQARYEYFDWDDRDAEPDPGGDLSGFSLPRVTLKFSGQATCDVTYYVELEFGDHGSMFDNNVDSPFAQKGSRMNLAALDFFYDGPGDGAGFADEAYDDQVVREGWINYEVSPQFNVRMGLVKTATTRQLMTSPEHQQFIDVSLASAYVGNMMPGYTDRNRDYGIAIHGAFGCDGEFSYYATITNGDGPVHRNVLDGNTDDNLAYSARVNWDLKGHCGYEEGALRMHECEWTAALGAWVYVYNDVAEDNSHVKFADRFNWGVDAHVGYGGWSLELAYSTTDFTDSFDTNFTDNNGWSYLAQLGFLFPDTAWEVAVRYSAYHHEFDTSPVFDGRTDFGGTEIAVAVNYYVDGHSDKLSADVAFITADDDGNNLSDVYAAYHVTNDSDGMLVRFQWQLAL